MNHSEKSEHIPYPFEKQSIETIEHKSGAYYELMNKRRSIRHFSDEPVPKSIIANIIKTAGTAPSGANKQPWTFCAVNSEQLKREIRIAAEEEEFASYHGRMNQEWLSDLEPLGTDWHKPFLETAPWLIVIFKKVYNLHEEQKSSNYYVNESVGIAAGILISAIHEAGLTTLTHTPSPMNFLTKILHRPASERPYLLLPVGFPVADCTVPNIQRKPLDDIAIFFE